MIIPDEAIAMAAEPRLKAAEERIDKELLNAINFDPFKTNFTIKISSTDYATMGILAPKYKAAGWQNVQKDYYNGAYRCIFHHNFDYTKLLETTNTLQAKVEAHE
jgi:hypothetical protein